MRPTLLLLLVITTLPGTLPAQLNPLPYRPITEQYSSSRDRIIMITTNPDQLHIYDPATQADLPVNLPKVPNALAVSPDGNYAAVGHDSLVSYVSLASASVLKTVVVSAVVKNIVLGTNYAWVFPGLITINLNSGTVVSSSSTSAVFYSYYGTNGVLNASGTAVYVSADGSSPNDMARIDVSAGPPGASKSWPYHGDYADCSPYWLSADGTRIYTGCGTVVHSSNDPNLDMYYAGTLPVASFPLAGLAEAPNLKLVAAIPSTYAFNPNPPTNLDTQVQLFSSDYLNPAGTLTLSPFVTPVGSFASHGKAVFFNKDGSRLYVVVQADATANTANNFAVQTINLASPPVCAPTFKSANASVPASGSLGSVAITAAPDCIYTAMSNADWIQLTNGSYGSGNGTLNWIARPNSSSQSRIGTISVGAETFAISQAGATANPAPLIGLSFNVVDADYSTALDRIVAISANPNELHIYDPAAQADQIVPLVSAPFSVSIAPDGMRAAVGHDGWISYVDLRTASVAHVFPIVTDVHHVLLAGNGYIYAFPQRAWSDMYSVAISTGTVTATSAIYNGRIPRLEPNGKYFYLGDVSWLSKWDITQGVAKLYTSAPGQSACANYWLYQDGSQLVSGCGKTYAVSDTKGQDLQPTGTLSNASSLTWAANSTVLQSTAVIPASGITASSAADTQIQFYGTAYLGYAGSLLLPQFSVGDSSYAAHGQFAFWSSDSSKLHVIVKADSTAKLASSNAVYTISPSQPAAGCSVTLGAPAFTAPAAAGFGSVSVTSDSTCSWAASSDSPWLTIAAGIVGGGSGTVSWSMASNPGTDNRNAIITIAGQAVRVMQLGTGVVPLTVNPAALSFSFRWGSTTQPDSQTVKITGATPNFTASANAQWLSVAPSAGFLPGTVTVSVNPAGLSVGTYVSGVTITTSDQQTQTIAITLTVVAHLSVSPSSLSLQYTLGGPAPTGTLNISSGAKSGYTLSRGAGSWLIVNPATGTLPATAQVTVVPSGLSAGSYNSSLLISAGGETLTVPVTLTVGSVPVTITAIGSAANFSAGAVSPGEMVVIGGTGLGPSQLTMFALTPLGALPTAIGGTQVFFDGRAAPLIYTSSTAIAAMVPYAVAGQITTNVQVVSSGSRSAVFAQAVAPTAPNLFTTTYGVQGQLVAFNFDYSQNLATNPAVLGSVVILWATGEGVTSPPGVDGTMVGSKLTQPLANVRVTIGERPADVIYAGGSPGSVEGLLQLNVRIPSDVTPGAQVPVSLQIGSATSPAGGTIAVR